MAEDRANQPMTFVVQTDASALRWSANGSITGPLFLEVGGVAFPGPGWSDFPVVVLGWWIRGVLELQRTGVSASCMFMDGPFEFELGPAGLSAWELKLVERRASGVQVVRRERVSPSAVLLALHVAASAVLDACAERGWSSKELDELQSARNVLVQ